MSGCYVTRSRRPATRRVLSVRLAVGVARAALEHLLVQAHAADRCAGTGLPVAMLFPKRRADAMRAASEDLYLYPARVREQAVRLLASAQSAGHVETRHSRLLHLGGGRRYPQGPMNSPFGWAQRMSRTTTIRTTLSSSSPNSKMRRCVCNGGNSICLSRGLHQALSRGLVAMVPPPTRPALWRDLPAEAASVRALATRRPARACRRRREGAQSAPRASDSRAKPSRSRPPP